MHARVAELIALLNLEPHFEGGHYARIYRSNVLVSPHDSRGPRAALTSIYFLLAQGEHARWHSILSDEAWHWYEGSPLELLIAEPEGGPVSSRVLGPLSTNSAPTVVVPAGRWQAARSLGAYTLAGCSVAPGFDYSDFRFLSSIPEPQRPTFTPTSVLAELLQEHSRA